MKKGKKGWSILLAIVMLLSSFSTLFAVMAADELQKPEKVVDLEKRMAECKLNISNASATPENIAIVTGMAEEFKALNELEKDMIAPDAFGNIYNRLYQYENFLDKEPASMERGERLVEKVEDRFGPHAAREEVKAVGRLFTTPFSYTTADGKTATATLSSYNFSSTDNVIKAIQADSKTFEKVIDDFKAAYAALSATARGYLTIYHAAFPAANTAEKFQGYSSPRDAFLILTQFSACIEASKAEPFTKPQPPSTDKEARTKWDVEKADWYFQFLVKAMKEMAELAPEYEKAVTLLLTLREAFDDFVKTDRLDKVKDALSLYDGMDRWYQYLCSSGWNFNFYTYLVQTSTTWYAANITAKDIYKKCVDTGLVSLISDLTSLVNAKDLSQITNKDVAEVQAIYNKIPADLRQKIDPEVHAKYNAIVALYVPVAPMEPDTDKPEIYEPAAVSYPDGLTKERTAQTVAALQETLLGLIGGIDAVKQAGSLDNLLKTGVYTNGAVGTALKTIYDMLATIEGIPLDLLKVAPKKVAANLEEEKFAGAKAKMLAVPSFETVAGWGELSFADGDWGFEDGDQEGFIKAVIAGLRPVVDLIDNTPLVGVILKLPNYKSANGDHNYGAYEDLIPILEGLGLEGVLSSAEYTALYDNAATRGEKLDTILFPILKPVLGLVNNLVEAPVDTLLDLLPRLAMLVNDGTLNTQVNKVLGKLSYIVTNALGFSSIDLSGDALNTMLSGLLASIVITPEQTDENGNVTVPAVTLSMTLPPIDWSLLSHCATFAVTDSVSAANAYRVEVMPDRADTFVVAFRYLYGTLMQADNLASLTQALKATLDEQTFSTVSSLITLVKGMGADEALVMIADLLAPIEPDPTDPANPTDPADPSDPAAPSDPADPGSSGNVSTGDAAVCAIAAVGLIAGAAFFLSRKKK